MTPKPETLLQQIYAEHDRVNLSRNVTDHIERLNQLEKVIAHQKVLYRPQLKANKLAMTDTFKTS